MELPVMIFGAGSIAKHALSIFESNKIVVYGFLDEDEKRHGEEIESIPILGHPEDHGFLKLVGQKCEGFVAVADLAMRKRYVSMLMDQRKVMPTNAVHGAAYIDQYASLGYGNFINAGAIVGPGSRIGQHCLIETGVIVGADVEIGDFVHIGAGSVINDGVKVEAGSFVGSGVRVVSGVQMGKNVNVGAGSLVVGNVEAGTTVFGAPAAPIE
jgi:sugar O-acyltransferase (sialic acid O-acetyltransferase NeuD family)